MSDFELKKCNIPNSSEISRGNYPGATIGLRRAIAGRRINWWILGVLPFFWLEVRGTPFFDRKIDFSSTPNTEKPNTPIPEKWAKWTKNELRRNQTRVATSEGTRTTIWAAIPIIYRTLYVYTAFTYIVARGILQVLYTNDFETHKNVDHNFL